MRALATTAIGVLCVVGLTSPAEAPSERDHHARFVPTTSGSTSVAAVDVPPPAPAPEAPRCAPGPPELRLLATLVASAGPSAAVIEPWDGVSRIVGEGGAVRGYRVVDVNRQRARLSHKGACYDLARRRSSGTTASVRPTARATASNGGLTLTRAALAEILADPRAHLKNVRVRFDRAPGRRAAFVVSHLKEGSLLHRAGLRRGDRLIGVDGVAVESPNDALRVAAAFMERGRAGVTVERGDRVVVLEATLAE